MNLFETGTMIVVEDSMEPVTYIIMHVVMRQFSVRNPKAKILIL